jgi:hypothetical protein
VMLLVCVITGYFFDTHPRPRPGTHDSLDSRFHGKVRE